MDAPPALETPVRCPLEIAELVTSKDLAVVAVLSGNRNFEGRIHAQVKASYLASPPLCVAYALAGTVKCDLTTDPLGSERGWPTHLSEGYLAHGRRKCNPWSPPRCLPMNSTSNTVASSLAMPSGRACRRPPAHLFDWDNTSTYVREPPYFIGSCSAHEASADITGARILALLGDSITTDHISPAGSIPVDSPAGQYLLEHSVSHAEFNSFGSRRGNHEVMMRGTFGNIRLRNLMVPGREGPWTRHVPSGDTMSIYDAAVRYQQEATPLVVIAGQEYGSGSSRDWAAKGSALLGIKAVIAQSYERIHRSNLVCMGVLPLQFAAGESAQSLGLTGFETVTISGIGGGITPQQNAQVSITRQNNTTAEIDTLVRIDAAAEVEYFRNGGILQMVLRQLLSA